MGSEVKALNSCVSVLIEIAEGLHAAKRSSGCYWTVDMQSSILMVGFLVVVCVCVMKKGRGVW